MTPTHFYSLALDVNKAARVVVQNLVSIDPFYAVQVDAVMSAAFQNFLDAPTEKNVAAYFDTVASVRKQVSRILESL